MARNVNFACLVVVLLAPIVASGQKSKTSDDASILLTLTSGETIEGRIEEETDERIVFATWLGRRELPPLTVVARRPAQPLREAYRVELQKIDKERIEDRVTLARWCLTRGFSSGLAAELDAILRMDPSHGFPAALIDKMAPVYRLAGRNDQPEDKPRWARREVDLIYLAAKEQSFFGAAMLARQLASFPMTIQTNEALDQARRGSEPQRYIAVQALGRSEETRRVKPLYRRALGDPSPQVRHQAVVSLIKHDDGTTAGPFLKALLESDYGSIRTHAAEALGMLGDTRAVPSLISALAATAPSGSARNNIRIGRQKAYVKDFDVEIAQAAVIADPIVDIVEEGVVLDVAVISVGIERRIYNATLQRLTGAAIEGSAEDWATWWRENGNKLVEGK